MEEEHYTPSEASRVLRRSGRPVSERRIRQMLQAGELEGEQSQTGRWSIPRRVVHELLEQYPRSDTTGVGDVATPKKSAAGAESPAEASESFAELMERVQSLSYRLGAAERQIELTERAESSVREERDRLASELEREREERQRLSEELQRRSEPTSPDVQHMESESRDTRPLWRRIISEITRNR